MAGGAPLGWFHFGTMTMGEQSGATNSLHLMDAVFDGGLNFFDSAEMYPVPRCSDTHRRCEELLGRWLLASRAPGDQIVIATKVAGPYGQIMLIQGRPTSFG